MQAAALKITEYVSEHVRLSRHSKNSVMRADTTARIEKALSLLPEEVLDLFLSEKRSLIVLIEPNLKIPFGMSTKAERTPSGPNYTITLREEHEEWPEDLFLGAFLRELGHVVGERPPEQDWPAARGDRARFRERLECVADAMVWKWGLRHYSMRHLYATYPEHWAERIVTEIGKIMLEDERFN
ncbi:MAG: hypothetical protein HY912_19050 [Desulfomonile tiedjei]|uniref:Uncharacterized protein n=1 Tax=Desulfomonile tiedjei TaxID=2358 RepID=A0A9D6Z510_9BACT|nr:hypothetical protein [Desulfomonile tiedjei]